MACIDTEQQADLANIEQDDALTITGHQTDGSTLPLNEGPRPGGEARV